MLLGPQENPIPICLFLGISFNTFLTVFKIFLSGGHKVWDYLKRDEFQAKLDSGLLVVL